MNLMRDRGEAGAASVVPAAMLGEHGREGIDEGGSLRHRRAHCSWLMRGNWRGDGGPGAREEHVRLVLP